MEVELGVTVALERHLNGKRHHIDIGSFGAEFNKHSYVSVK
jgi:hypothetical protein